eukprot:PITA_10718
MLIIQCRGMASASKKLALQRLFEVEPTDIILLQETLGQAEYIIHSLQSLVPRWNFGALDVVGRSGGLAIGFNPRSIRVDASWGGSGFMGIDVFSTELSKTLRIVNVYGPCYQREHFWHHLLNLSLLAPDHIIIGGDLNFSLGFSESWGSSAQVDAITGHMTNLMEQTNFIDVPMHKPLPTWRNRRVGDDALARRLDRFLMKGPLFQQLHHYKKWVDTGGISDHSPIYLEILGPHHKPKAPFKFNHTWLQDPNFIKLVSDFWIANPINREESLAKGFYKNLTMLKHIAINWAKDKQSRENAQLTHIEAELSSLLDGRNLGFISRDEKARLIKFFRNYAKGRKVTNTIWNLPLPEGGLADSFNKLYQLGTSHFRNIYRSPPGTNLAEIINVANHFLRFFNEEDSEELFAPVTARELESTLKWFKKDKSPGLDGWTIEFYLAFYELLGPDLLKVVEESRTTRYLYHAINSTSIALIPKSDSPSSFDDYRPISLCNYIYNIISKIIANRLRPILSRNIAPQQFAFLEDRQIHEAIGSAQEALHSIWSKHLKSIILKIDLSKAFDRVSWLYIKMLLIHLGLPHHFITWIMACITTPTFSVLINGSASHFFHCERGLRQGCPLSPLLFLIVMEDGSIRDSLAFSRILHLFSTATGMLVNHHKSTITFARTSVHESQYSQQVFPYSIHPLDRGLKYLGYWLKPTCQKIAEWVWLVTKLEKRLICWSQKFLSGAGRLVLIKSVLEATPVFWMALAWIPRNILSRLQQLCNRYLWAGNQDKKIFTLISWQKIAFPKRWGGWGLKDLPLFAQALAAKIGWTLLTRQNLWLIYHIINTYGLKT